MRYEAQGFTLFANGDFNAARAALSNSLQLCDDDAGSEYIELSAQDPRVHVRLYEAMALWFLGYPDKALESCAEARRYADKLQHPFSQAMAYSISLRLHQLRGESALVAELAVDAVALCELHGIIHYAAMARILHGWAVAREGDPKKGISEILTNLDTVRETGGLLYESYILALLAEAYSDAGRFDEALTTLDQAQARAADENSERFYAAEIQRLRGDVCLRSGRDPEVAERYLQRGLRIARKQKARTLELKLCTTLFDLLSSTECGPQTRSELAEIYSWFSEGSDTVSLKEAKSRLSKSS